MTSCCLIRTIITDVGKISYACSYGLAFIKVSAYGQIGRNFIINFLHRLSRFPARYWQEHRGDCAQLIPAWERTYVLNTEAEEASKIITQIISYTIQYEQHCNSRLYKSVTVAT
jgi:superfamily II RNA helicase